MFRKRFQKGTEKIFDQLESNVPYPKGGRVELAKGAPTAANFKRAAKTAKKPKKKK